MSNKVFYGFLGFGIVGFLAFALFKNQPEQLRPGLAQADNGRTHVQSKDYGGNEPPTSGDHATPLDWQAYDSDVPDANVIHNMEHGGVYISYRHNLPKEQVEKIVELFSKPFSNPKFTPSKAIVAPREKNKSAITMSSWTRSESFETFNEQAMIDYYVRNVSKSPEAGAN